VAPQPLPRPVPSSQRCDYFFLAFFAGAFFAAFLAGAFFAGAFLAAFFAAFFAAFGANSFTSFAFAKWCP
jgi:hypothetical protein